MSRVQRPPTRLPRSWSLAVLALALALAFRTFAAPPDLELRDVSAGGRWTALHDATVQATSEGLVVRSSGEDPYVQGPALDFGTNGPLWLRVRLRSTHFQ